MSDEELYARVAARWGFQIPEEYRAMRRRGWFTLEGPGSWEAFTAPGNHYLWLHEMEWMTPEDMANHQFAEWERDDFVPFAFTGGGDHWCWWPARSGPEGAPVFLCPHDSGMATLYAPHLPAALFRQALECAGSISGPEDAEVVRAMLARWHTDLGPLFPPAWAKTLAWVRHEPLKSWKLGRLDLYGLLTPEEVAEIERRELAIPEMDQEFDWHRE